MTYEEFKTLLEEAEEHRTAGRYDEAVRLAKALLDAFNAMQGDEIIGSDDINHQQQRDDLQCSALLMLSDTARRRGELDHSLVRAQEALSVAERSDVPALKARALGNIGNVYSDFSDYAQALDYYGKALRIAEDLGYKAGIATHLGNIGLLHWKLSDFTKALECCVAALSIDEELDDDAGVAIHLGNIGLVHGSLLDYPKALECYVKALRIDEVLGNKAGVALWLGNIGTVYAQLSKYSEAREYYGKALSIAEELGNKAGVANNLGNIGNLFQKEGDYDRALEYYSRGQHIHEESGQKAEAATRQANIGALYSTVEWSGYDESTAERYLLNSIATNRELGTRRYEAHKTLAELYERQNRWQEANREWKHYHGLKDEVLSEEAMKSALQMEQKKLIAEREKELSLERAVARATQNILYQVLPALVADRLVKGEKVADYFQNVSILFADIVGFTPIVSRMPAKAVLAFLNYVFNEFDSIVERHGCEKIKTIGDGYMAVAGVPVECNDHAERIALAALEMIDDIHLPDEIRKHLPKGSQFSIRIGLHTGSAFAGIVGAKRFVYDVYSDAVNIAARMESHGEPGRIHCSAEFALHLQNRDERFVFEEREEVEIKGKGMMRTYFLEKA